MKLIIKTEGGFTFERSFMPIDQAQLCVNTWADNPSGTPHMPIIVPIIDGHPWIIASDKIIMMTVEENEKV